MPPVNTTVDRSETPNAQNQVSAWGLVLIWSNSEFHRAAELGFLPGMERIILGRQDNGTEMMMRFAPHRPGEPHAPRGDASLIADDGISRRQLELLATAVGIEMKNVGKCRTLVNGKETKNALLKAGDLLFLPLEALFMVVKRPRMLEGPRALHAFGGPDANGIAGESPAIWDLRALIDVVAPTDDFVLIRGESGTGKELVAAALHRGSPRAKGPYVTQNASNFPPGLIEAEVYGNIADYPHAGIPARPGILFLAHNGTLFLDEIGDLPIEAQAHLLRVLDERGEFRRLGDAALRHVDMRVFGATNKDDSAFRTDFAARLPVTVHIPPVRARREDIPLLIRHWMFARGRQYADFAKRFIRQGSVHGAEPRISGYLVEYIMRQQLLTNYRGLNNILLQALTASREGELVLPKALAEADAAAMAAVADTVPVVDTDPGADTLPIADTAPIADPTSEGARARGPASKPSPEQLLAVLERVDWNKSHAGDALGINRNRVRELIKEYELKRGKTGE
jgi:DNA-binding NtrC family response regulator